MEEAEAEAVLSEMGAVLMASEVQPKLVTRLLLGGLGLRDQHDALSKDMSSAAAAAVEEASGTKGESIKGLAECKSVMRQWRIFLAVSGHGEDVEPTLEMVENFTSMLFWYRSRADVRGRTGLGDGAAKKASFVLAQVRAQ